VEVLVGTEGVQQMRDLARVEVRERILDHFLVSVEVLRKRATWTRLARVLLLDWGGGARAPTLAGNRRLTGDLGMTNTFTACVIRTNELFLIFPRPRSSSVTTQEAQRLRYAWGRVEYGERE
jgi:hypothetical protein